MFNAILAEKNSSNDYNIDTLHFNWEGIPTIFITPSNKIS